MHTFIRFDIVRAEHGAVTEALMRMARLADAQMAADVADLFAEQANAAAAEASGAEFL